MSNTHKLGVWAGRTIPAYRAGASRSRRLTPPVLPLARYGTPPPPPRLRLPAAIRRTLARGDR